MKAKHCSNPNCDYVGTLFKSSPPLCKNCAMKYNYQNKEKVADSGLNKAREVKKYVIPKVSDKQAKINALYSVLRKQYLKDHPNCQVKLRVCSGKATEIHHTHFGSDKRTHFLDSSTFKSICRHCHRFIHDEMSSKEQRERGLKIN